MALKNKSSKDNGSSKSEQKSSEHSKKDGKTAGEKSSLSSRLFSSFIIALVAIAIYKYYEMMNAANVIKRFDEENLLRLKYSPNKWGSLRSTTYHGMKTMSPKSLVTGLMWFRNRIEQNNIPIRHWCSEGDRLSSYGYTRHNFDNFGIQNLIDQDINITTIHVIDDDKENWSAKILFEPKNKDVKYEGVPLSIIYYVATENEDDTINVPVDIETLTDDSFHVFGSSATIDQFDVAMKVDPAYSQNVLFRGYLTADAQPPLVNLKEEVMKSLAILNHGHEQLIVVKQRDDGPMKINFIAHQIVFRPPFALNVQFNPQKSGPDSFETKVNEKSQEFDKKFEDILHLKSKGFKANEIEFAKRALSNMIGSTGYFYGTSLVQSKYQNEPVAYGPLELLTAVPSRSFFPRGFLWDEGFHNLLIARFKPELSVQIVRSWLNLINAEGWIPREVILGKEAEARVPQEFIVQRNTNANPPTLFLTIETLLKRNQLTKTDLKDMYPRLELWYSWFNKTQVGIEYSTYRWRGRGDPKALKELNPKTLTSGLDDYPRATHPTDLERHVDLRSWMALASRVMAKISKMLEIENREYQATYEVLSDNQRLDALHWNSKLNCYNDYGFHSTKVSLVLQAIKGQENVPPHMIKTEMVRKTQEEPTYQLVPEYGYVSLFPMLLELIEPESPKLGLLLETLRNPSLLWTKFGLRSLAKSSFYYQTRNTQHDPPYWRGAIWININYLALRSLHHYSSVEGPHRATAKKVYDELRNNLITNVVKQYETSGYMWEQYDDITGAGKGSHPFTGWSALIVLAMAEEY